MKTERYVKLIGSAYSKNDSVLEMNIFPAEKTPWHYHTLFAETFEILKGTLELGHNNEVFQLKEGDIITVTPNEKHYFFGNRQKT